MWIATFTRPNMLEAHAMARLTRTPSTTLFLLLGILNLTVAVPDRQSALQTAKHWKLFTFNFLPNAPVNDVNFYNPTNVLATGLAVAYDRIFIASPKLFSGVPSTVNFVSKAEFGDSPVLQAYPDWSFSTTARTDFNCSDLVLISVYRLRIDSCNRLWMLDAGISRSVEDYEKTCPPKLLVVDLHTDQVVRRIDFPPEILRGESLFTNLVIDETTSKAGNCDDVFVYITDTVEPAIVVYDSERDVTWRLTHPAMYPDPDFAESEILSHRFILMDGVVGLTFDEKTGIVYFQPLATDRIFSVTKDALRAGPLAQNQILPVKLLGKKSSQGIGMVISPVDGSLLFSPVSETAIASWNPHTNKQSVLAYDRDRLQFVADIITTRAEPGVIYAISSKFHRFFLKNLNTNEYNLRILRIEFPSASYDTHSGLASVHANLPDYSLKSLAPFSSPYGNFYQTNSLTKTPSAAPTLGYFTSSSIPKHPYSYEPVGVINYSVRNPFTALNHGESFPPPKGYRNTAQKSFLESLAATPVASLPSQKQLLHTTMPISTGYYYARGKRNIKTAEKST